MIAIRPERLNLAIARRCYVRCRGCYQFFGRGEPDTSAVQASVAQFVRLGISSVTLSGGDPLTLRGLPALIADLRAVGVVDIKLDTVGTGLLEVGLKPPPLRIRLDHLRDLLASVDHLGLPLDGSSNASVALFRTGRSELFRETVALLEAIDGCTNCRPVVVNTVVHRQNSGELTAILKEVSRHRSITHWNLFQYTPTDQVGSGVNDEFAIDEQNFTGACVDMLNQVGRLPREQTQFTIGPRTIRSRLGQYLLMNSDGECWLPDEKGQTVPLGPAFGREAAVLTAWGDAVLRIHGSAGRTSSLHGNTPHLGAKKPDFADVA
ncbi:MAG TPA: radical SAM protein [Longimicrobiaceae bacterium]|nr:radical SAM protein [Longimicrobiaceae bacterium]